MSWTHFTRVLMSIGIAVRRRALSESRGRVGVHYGYSDLKCSVVIYYAPPVAEG